MSPASICPRMCLNETKLAQQGRKKSRLFEEKEELTAFKLYHLHNRRISQEAAG